MRQFVRLAFAAAIAAMLSLSAAAQTPSGWQEVTGPDGSFSFAMPIKPQQDRRNSESYGLPAESILYVLANPPRSVLLAVQSKYHPDAKVNPANELEANVINFAAQVKGKTISSRLIDWERTPGDSLRAIEATTENGSHIFLQLYVLQGNTVFGVMGAYQKGASADEASTFIKSLRIRKP
jgi:hypothetical protein